MGIDARGVLAELREVCSMPLQEGIKVCLGSPVGIVDDTGAVCAFVQCCPDVARLIPHLFGEANPLMHERLSLPMNALDEKERLFRWTMAPGEEQVLHRLLQKVFDALWPPDDAARHGQGNQPMDQAPASFH